MKRNPRKYHAPEPLEDIHNAATADDIVELSLSIFGDNAVMAIAYCAIDARLNGDKHSFQKLVKAFKRLQN